MPKETMKAVAVGAKPTLESLAVSERAVPALGPNDALVRVRATSLNYHDYMIASGQLPVEEGRIPMSDGAGEVVAVGDAVQGLAPGDKVMGTFFPNWLSGEPTRENTGAVAGDTVDGFAAEYVAMPAASFTPMPKSYSFEQAATLPCAALTAWRALVAEGQLKPGEKVLLQGSGGVSVFALQLAKAMGAEVFITSSSDEKLERLKEMGADHLLNYRKEPEWGRRIKEMTDGRGVDLVLDVGGAETMPQSVAACCLRGHVAMIGVLSGAELKLSLGSLLMRHIRLTGLAVGSNEQQRALVSFIDAKGIEPVIDSAFSFDQLADAFRHEESGRHFGKIVVRI